MRVSSTYIPTTFVNSAKSYYTAWNSPIRGAVSRYSIYVVLDTKLDLDIKQIETQGLCFKDKYSALKYQKPGLLKMKSAKIILKWKGVLENKPLKKK